MNVLTDPNDGVFNSSVLRRLIETVPEKTVLTLPEGPVPLAGPLEITRPVTLVGSGQATMLYNSRPIGDLVGLPFANGALIKVFAPCQIGQLTLKGYTQQDILSLMESQGLDTLNSDTRKEKGATGVHCIKSMSAVRVDIFDVTCEGFYQQVFEGVTTDGKTSRLTMRRITNLQSWISCVQGGGEFSDISLGSAPALQTYVDNGDPNAGIITVEGTPNGCLDNNAQVIYCPQYHRVVIRDSVLSSSYYNRSFLTLMQDGDDPDSLMPSTITDSVIKNFDVRTCAFGHPAYKNLTFHGEGTLSIQGDAVIDNCYFNDQYRISSRKPGPRRVVIRDSRLSGKSAFRSYNPVCRWVLRNVETIGDNGEPGTVQIDGGVDFLILDSVRVDATIDQQMARFQKSKDRHIVLNHLFCNDGKIPAGTY